MQLLIVTSHSIKETLPRGPGNPGSPFLPGAPISPISVLISTILSGPRGPGSPRLPGEIKRTFKRRDFELPNMPESRAAAPRKQLAYRNYVEAVN